MHICLLDIDGTLILTGSAGHAAFAETLADEFGIGEMNGEVLFAGRSDRAIVMDLFRHHGVDPTEENWQRFCRSYLGRLQSILATRQGCVLPGVHDLLNALSARGDVAIGLLTGNIREGARHKLSHYGLWHWFPFGGFGDEHTERCDIAAAALLAAKTHLRQSAARPLGVAQGESTLAGPKTPSLCPLPAGEHSNGRPSHGEVIVIGDTLHDIRCGRSIGARCVAVATGHTSIGELQTSGPDVAVTTLEEIDPILALLNSHA